MITGVILGLVIGFILGNLTGFVAGYMLARATTTKPSGIVFGRDANGNIVSINYV
jgi:F0F1-type ATP synthase assembly protein I